MPVAVVTDSTSYLPTDAAGADLGPVSPVVVPLTVVISGEQGREGIDVSPADVARALAERRVAVSTSQPAPEQFREVYRRLLDHGASGIVSVHLSEHLSGTVAAARSAAAEFGPAVAVVDARSTGMAVGFAALAAARAAAGGQDRAAVVAAASDSVAETETLFYVDTLEFLRRGGRIGMASALVGTALAVKPILYLAEGQVQVRDKVRTTSRALARLVDLAVEAGAGRDVDIAVHHFGVPARAIEVRDALRARLAGRLRAEYLSEVGAVVAAHVGPGLIGVVVHRHA
jgi:DegV family protein with EDD domain